MGDEEEAGATGQPTAFVQYSLESARLHLLVKNIASLGTKKSFLQRLRREVRNRFLSIVSTFFA